MTFQSILARISLFSLNVVCLLLSSNCSSRSVSPDERIRAFCSYMASGSSASSLDSSSFGYFSRKCGQPIWSKKSLFFNISGYLSSGGGKTLKLLNFMSTPEYATTFPTYFIEIPTAKLAVTLFVELFFSGFGAYRGSYVISIGFNSLITSLI